MYTNIMVTDVYKLYTIYYINIMITDVYKYNDYQCIQI